MSAPYYTRPLASLSLRDQVRADLAATYDGLANARWGHALEARERGYDDAEAIFARAAEILHELASELRRAVGT
jgi:hypothetical protein